MIYCDSPTLERWRAPLSPSDWLEPVDGEWTKLIAGDLVLSNCIEFADWESRPVWPHVCGKSCACSEWSGLAHIVRLPEQVLWVKPTIDDLDDFSQDLVSEEHFLREPVLIPEATWDELSAQFAQLTPYASLPRAARQHLGTLWLGGAPCDRDLRLRSLDEVRDFVERECVASDPVEEGDAVGTVLSMIDWLQSDPAAAVKGRIVPRADFSGRINTLYFDGPPFREWEAFALWTRTFVLDGEWVFVVDPGSTGL